MLRQMLAPLTCERARRDAHRVQASTLNAGGWGQCKVCTVVPMTKMPLSQRARGL